MNASKLYIESLITDSEKTLDQRLEVKYWRVAGRRHVPIREGWKETAKYELLRERAARNGPAC